MSVDEQAFMQELRLTFLEELDDVLDCVETAFLQFERTPDDKDILHEIFRYFHNIKGSSKTVGMTALSEFAHTAENLLSGLREGHISVSDEIVDCLLESADLLRDYSARVRDNAEDNEALSSKARQIATLLAREVSKDPKQKSEVAAAPPEVREEEVPVAAATNDGFQSFDDDDVSIAEQTFADEPLEELTDDTIAGQGGNSAGLNSVDQSVPADLTAAGELSLPVPAAMDAVVATDGTGNTQANPIGQAVKREEAIKVSMAKVNQILDLFGEQIIIQSSLDHAVEKPVHDVEYIRKSVSQLKKITQDLQYTMVTLRMISLEGLFNRLERSVRDVARITGKRVNFVRRGEAAELDKTIVDALIDPLTHMVRNAVDHGLEDAATRLAAGKPEAGNVILTASRSGGAFELVVEDDGKGLDRTKILRKAEAKGLVKPHMNLSDEQVFDLIFIGGFSTHEVATEISGRGVGMDVVRQQIRQLKGHCQISSEPGRGTRFTIKVPLSLAMFQGTIVLVNGERYVIPNSDFSEVITLDHYDDNSHVKDIVAQGDRVIRILDLRQILTCQKRPENPTKSPTPDIDGRSRDTNYRSPKAIAVITQHNNHSFGLLVDEILSQEQIVLKELGPEAKQVRGASGGTILGDGQVALVLDVSAIVRRNDLTSPRKVA